MTYLLKLQRTRNGTTTTHTVFADSYSIHPKSVDILFDDKVYFLTDAKCTEATEFTTPVTTESTFNNKFLLERLEAE